MGENANGNGNGDTGHNVQVQVQSSTPALVTQEEDRALEEEGRNEKNTNTNDNDNYHVNDNGNANEVNHLSRSPLLRVYDILTWTPPRCRWDPKNPPRLTMPLNLLFGFACTFTVRFPPLI